MYRKKPVIIEAVRWNGKYTDGTEWPDWFREAILSGVAHTSLDLSSSSLIIKTLEGDHEARVGDMIIQGVKGELYPCKSDIFAATYVPA
jgi:hypothetical protein